MVNKFYNRLKGTSFLVPFTLLILSILAYGLLIPTLGYYWDDWPYAYINHMFGPGGYPEFVASDRPYSAWIFMGLAALWGEEPLGYHLTSIFLYWICAILFWLFLRTLWPKREKQAFWGALIFAVYPGFLGHPNAIIYNHHYIAMALYLFSLIGNIKALNGGEKSWLWHIPSVLAMSLSQFSIEYYLGWEAVRTVMVWLILNQKHKGIRNGIKFSVSHLFPYWLGTLAFLIWRVVLFGFPTYQPLGGGQVDPISKVFVLTTFQEVLETAIIVWARVFPRLSSEPFSRGFWLLYLGMIMLTTAFVLLILRSSKNIRKAKKEGIERSFSGFALIMAPVGLLTAGLPFWLTGLTVQIEGFSSRFTLPFIPWAVLLLIALLHILEKNLFKHMPLVVTLIVAVIVGGAAGSQFWNANQYRNDWQEVQRYIIEMVHRIPGMEPGTTLVINDMRFLDLYSDNSLTALVNWTYSPGRVSKDLNYMVYYLSVRLGLGIPALEPGLPITQDYRSLHFSGTTDKLLVVYSDFESCLRVLDAQDIDRLPTSFPEEMIPVLPLSNLSLIDTDAENASPPGNIFDIDEGPTWCTYFEEADLAAQVGNWEHAAEIGDIAYALEDEANELTEHFVFIESYLRVGKVQQAWEISEMVSVRSQDVHDPALCSLWRSIEAEMQSMYEVNYNEAFCSGK